MRVLVFIFLFMASLNVVNGQSSNSKIKYFDSNWKPVKTRVASKYYRTVEKQGGKFIVKDFYTSTDKIQMEAECSAVKPELVFNGLVHYFNEDGTPSKTMFQRDESSKYVQYWSQSGEPLLTNGAGKLKKPNEAGYIVHSEIRDSVLYVEYFVRPEKNDTVYNVVSVKAEFRGGMSGFYWRLEQNLIYPQDAIILRLQGVVFVQFVINKSGYLEDVSVQKGLSESCNKAAMNAVLSIGRPWNPALFEGKAVKQLFIIPIVFKLD